MNKSAIDVNGPYQTEDTRRGVWVVVGSIVISFGASTIVREAFPGNILHVYFGVIIFFAGYQFLVITVQKGHGPRAFGQGVQTHLHQWHTDPGNMVQRYLIANIGACGLALGIQLFTTTILQPDLILALLSGVLSFSGYLLSHRAIEGGLI